MLGCLGCTVPAARRRSTWKLRGHVHQESSSCCVYCVVAIRARLRWRCTSVTAASSCSPAAVRHLLGASSRAVHAHRRHLRGRGRPASYRVPAVVSSRSSTQCTIRQRSSRVSMPVLVMTYFSRQLPVPRLTPRARHFSTAVPAAGDVQILFMHLAESLAGRHVPCWRTLDPFPPLPPSC